MTDLTLFFATIALFIGAMVVVAVVGILHERRAQARERDAIQRHEAEMGALRDARALTLAAINQRNRLDERVAWALTAIADHAAHLEALGIKAPLKQIPSDLLR